MKKFVKSASALAAYIVLAPAFGQAAAPAPAADASEAAVAGTDGGSQSVVIAAKRENRVSKGATGLPMEIKDTPQTISTVDAEDMKNFHATRSNDALAMGTGIDVERWETNRTTYISRGFDIQLTQIDGLGMTNDWGTVVGQLDTFLFDRIELIRGANGLLTGVGNASGTINYVRKRPTNRDGGELDLSAGSWNALRGAVDYNKVLTSDGSWAARVVAVHEDSDSYLHALHDKRSTLYGVVDGQVGDHGVLTFGATLQDARQRSPMWGSLTLNRTDGTQADFPVSSSTSQDWTFWNTRSHGGFVEYTHDLGAGWEAKVTYNHHDDAQDVRLFYAYVPDGPINPDNTGLVGWPYAAHVVTRNDIVDANVGGRFVAFGRQHSVLLGISRSRQTIATDEYAFDPSLIGLPLPAFPYGGDVYAQPLFGDRTRTGNGAQTLTRVYGAAHLALTDALKGVVGVNAVQLRRSGASLYGDVATTNDYPKTEKLSPYVGATYDMTRDALAYVSWSDIFQNQDQTDIDGGYLPPVRGVNVEAGVKAEWLDRKLLTTFALFQAQERGLATYAGLNDAGNYYYVPQDIESKGFEAEATGRLGGGVKLTLGFTHLALLGPDGHSTNTWVPRNMANARMEAPVPGLPALQFGVDARWRSLAYNAARQGGYLVANGFVAWDATPKATVRLNVNNLFDRKYVEGIENGALYGAPTNGVLSLEYKL